MVTELSELVKKAKTKEEIKAVNISQEFEQANPDEQTLANIVLNFAYLRCELGEIKDRLEKIEKRIK